MQHKKKAVRWVTLKSGLNVKTWLNHKTGGILPTNWKTQSSLLATLKPKALARG